MFFAATIGFLILTRANAGAESGVFYTTGFEAGVGAEWSTNAAAQAPSGRKYLGQFGTNTVRLTVGSLPAHTNLIVSFDLMTMGIWRGNVRPDVFDLRVAGATNALVHTTFAQRRNAGLQAFPGAGPSSGTAQFLARTGAKQIDTLGYTNLDSTYRISVAFAHTDATVVLEFSATNLPPTISWGIDDVVVGYGSAPVVTLSSVLDANGNFNFTAPAQFNVVGSVSGNEIARIELLTNGVFVREITGSQFTNTLSGIGAGNLPVTVRAINAGGIASETSLYITINGLRAEYYSGTGFGGTKRVIQDANVDFSFEDRRPVPDIGADGFSIRWLGWIAPRFTENYTLATRTDDGARLWIDGVRIIDEWHGQAGTRHGFTVPMEAGRRYFVQMDYYDGACCGAGAHLDWQSASQIEEVVPNAALEPFSGATNRPPNKPVIIAPLLIANPLEIATNLQFATDQFFDPNSTDTHAATDWEIWTRFSKQRIWSALGMTGTNRLTTSLAMGVFENSHAGRTNLFPLTHYVLRVRHRDNSGVAATQWSEYAERHFDTAPRTLAVESVFDSTTEGWTTWDSIPPYRAVRFEAAEGNPGGAAAFTESGGDGATTFWVAPAKFLGERAGLYGGTFSFQLRQSTDDNQYSGIDLQIGGGGVRLVYDLKRNPGTNWTSYAVALTEEDRWQVGSLDGPAPSRVEFLQILAGMTNLMIRGEYKNGNNEIGYLDNVQLTRPVAVGAALLRATRLGNGEALLRWPENAADFQLVQSTSLEANANWQPVAGVPLLLNEFFELPVDPTPEPRFFQLKR
jgi:hypothetical protein